MFDFLDYQREKLSVDTTALLPEHNEGYSDFLPLGIKAFYSTYRWQPPVWYALACLISFFPMTAFLALVSRTKEGAVTGASELFFSLSLIILFIGGLIFLLSVFRSWTVYNNKIAQGSWMEGVFVFPTTGDIVIRFHSMWCFEEQTFQRHNIINIKLTRRFSSIACRERKYMRITHLHGVYEFDAERLREKPEDVLHYLVDVCRKDHHSGKV